MYAARGQLTSVSSLGRAAFRPFPASCQAGRSPSEPPFAKVGIERGDRVGIRLPNGNAWALAFFGIQMFGAVAVPVNTRFTESEIEYVVTDSGASYVFEPGTGLPDGDPVVVDDLGHKDLSAIFYTSGTANRSATPPVPAFRGLP